MRWAIAVALLVACGKHEAARTPDDGAQPLGKTGVVIDIPPGWTIEEARNPPPKEAPKFHITDGKRSVTVRRWVFPPETLDELYAARCDKALARGIQEETPTMRYVQCEVEGPPQDRENRYTRGVSVVRGNAMLTCMFFATEDIELHAKVCKSMRSKDPVQR